LEFHLRFIEILVLSFKGLLLINTQGSTTLVLVLIVLLFFTFVISGAETAFFSLTHKDINMLKTKQQPNYKRIISLVEDPKILLGSLLVANCLITISIIIISNILLSNFLDPRPVNALWIEYVIKVVVVTTITILFGVVMPKILAAQNNIRFAKDSGSIVELIYLIFKRAGFWVIKYSDIVEKRLSKNGGGYSLEELDFAIDLTGDSNSTLAEKNILKGIIKFGNISVKQVMKTRIDVHGIDTSISFGKLIEQLGDLHYSRLPVYEEDLDKVVGMIHTKDIIQHINKPDDFNWHSITRDAYFVHEQKMIEDLLREFKAKHIHFAIVVDEFGGTSGIVTMEDILEEIIGDIKDEFDEDEINYTKIDDNNYIFEGKVMLNDVCKAMQISIDTFDEIKGESDSLAGLVLEIAGAIPKQEETISSGAFTFSILEIERNRLLKIKITINPQGE